MSKHKPTSKEKDATKEKGKTVQLVIRIAKSERAAFIAACEQLDTTAAREIRRFMREFVGANPHPAPAENPRSDAGFSETPMPTTEPAASPATMAEPLPAATTAAEPEKPAKAPKRVKA